MNRSRVLAGTFLAVVLLSAGVSRADAINSVTLNPVTNNADITWLWTTQNLVKASAGAGGNVSGNVNDWIDQGSNATLTATASNGYHFAGWAGVSGNTNANPITFAVDAVYTNALANFALNSYAITIHTDWGTASPGTTNVLYGSSLTETITPTNSIVPGRRAVLKGVNVQGHTYTQP